MMKSMSPWYAGLWRWHFYAAWIVIPIFAMLSVTGLTWLYRYDIQQALYPGVVSGFHSSTTHPLDHQLAAVAARYPEGQVLSVMEPWDNRATMFVVESGGKKEQVFVDPGTAQVTGAIEADTQIYDLAIQWHGDLTVGAAGDAIIELAACWALFMALSGYVLFFLRLRPGNGGPKQRLRNAHGWVGAVIGVGLLFQLVSGLPWTGIWGAQVQRLASGQGLSLWGEDPGAKSKLAPKLEAASGESAPAPWALGESEVPESGHHHGEAAGDHTGGFSLDILKDHAKTAGLPGPYLILLPQSETGVYSVLADQWMVKGNPAFSDVTQERVIHYDQYTGQEVGRYGYEQYSPAAKLVSQSIAIHEGRRFGVLNLIWSTLFCVGILFLCVTGPVLWWKRRHRGEGVGAPKVVLHLLNHRWILVLLGVMGVLLPLFGLSLIVLAILDRVIGKVPALSRFFNKS